MYWGEKLENYIIKRAIYGDIIMKIPVLIKFSLQYSCTFINFIPNDLFAINLS